MFHSVFSRSISLLDSLKYLCQGPIIANNLYYYALTVRVFICYIIAAAIPNQTVTAVICVSFRIDGPCCHSLGILFRIFRLASLSCVDVLRAIIYKQQYIYFYTLIHSISVDWIHISIYNTIWIIYDYFACLQNEIWKTHEYTFVFIIQYVHIFTHYYLILLYHILHMYIRVSRI